MTSEIKVDTISENTSANGVTIDGLTIKDGNIIGDVALAGTTPTFTVGDGGAEDAALIFDGNAVDYYIALDASADNLIIGSGSTVGSNSLITIDSNGDFTLDSAGDIILDADGGDIRFKDAGTEIAVFENSSSDLQIKASVQDKDIIFRGNDGGSGINALTLDMSAAGHATFNNQITATNGNFGSSVNTQGVLNLSNGGAEQIEFFTGASSGVSQIQAFNRNDSSYDNLEIIALDFKVKISGTEKLNIASNGEATFVNKITADAGIDIDNFNIDGTTIALSSGDITVDAAGRIDLSADDNGEVRLYDGSSMYGQFKDDSDNFIIQSLISDKDIHFVGNDCGSAITAMVIDMSEKGKVLIGGTGATFGELGITGHSNGDANIDMYASVGSSVRGKAEIFFSTDSSSDHVSIASIVGQQPSGDQASRKGEILLNVSDNGGPATALTVSNNGTVSGNLNDTSDENLKKNITDLGASTDLIKALKPRQFDWKQTSAGSNIAGFVAQEVASVIPTAVVGNDYIATTYYIETDDIPEGYAIGDIKDHGDKGKALNTTAILAHAVKTIQELEARITTLEG